MEPDTFGHWVGALVSMGRMLQRFSEVWMDVLSLRAMSASALSVRASLRARVLWCRLVTRSRDWSCVNSCDRRSGEMPMMRARLVDVIQGQSERKSMASFCAGLRVEGSI